MAGCTPRLMIPLSTNAPQRTVTRLNLCCCLLLLTAVAQAQTYNGSLEAGDPFRAEGVWYDAYTFEATTAQLVRVRMTSAAFDTYLILQSPTGVETVNDDFEGAAVSQLELLASEAGTWTVWASSYGGDTGGEYTLEIHLGGTGKLETLTGRLDPSDTVSLKGEYYDTHVIDMATSDPFIVELTSLGFDGYLVVTAPAGQVWRNDDTGSQTLSRVGPMQGSGQWRIDVTSAVAEEVGAYDVRIMTFPKN